MVGKGSNFQPQDSLPWFVPPLEVPREVGTNIQRTTHVRVDGHEDVEQAFNTHVLRLDLLLFFETWLTGANENR